jgi:hypothetical protein
MTRRERTPVTTRAVIQRINRKLKPDLEMLKVTRGNRWRREVGDYYVIDFNRNWIIHKHVDPVAGGSLAFLAFLGIIGAKAGGAHPFRPAVRVTFWGAFARALTAGIGSIFGKVV